METIAHFLYYAALIFFFAAGFVLRSTNLGKYLCSQEVLQDWLLLSSETKHLPEFGLKNLETTVSPIVPTYSIDWWKNESLFQLERRAIFSKRWLFVTHSCRFRKAGDYRTFEIVGFSVIVIFGKDHQLRAFQNVCRHRAYQVAKKECGSSTVLGCRYHGWSYDTRGKLIKAPEFENVPDFDKSQNSLWEVKLEIRDGLVFINMESIENSQNSELSTSATVMTNPKTQNLKCAVEWKIDGRFNWKLADTSFLANPSGITSWLSLSRFGHRKENLGYTAVIDKQTFGALLTLRFLPKSATTTTIECVLYKYNSSGSESEFESMKKSIHDKIKELEIQQKRLLQHRNSQGEIMKANSDRQTEIRQILKTHADEEHKLGDEIQPAAQSQSVTLEGKRDDEFCRELGAGKGGSICSASSQGLLDW